MLRLLSLGISSGHPLASIGLGLGLTKEAFNLKQSSVNATRVSIVTLLYYSKSFVGMCHGVLPLL